MKNKNYQGIQRCNKCGSRVLKVERTNEGQYLGSRCVVCGLLNVSGLTYVEK